MQTKETQEDTGDTAAHVNHGKAHPTWKRRNEPRMGRQAVCDRNTTKRGQGCCHTQLPSGVQCFVGLSCAENQNAAPNTPQSWSICTKELPPSFNWLQAACSQDRDLPSKSCCSEADGGMSFHSCPISQAENMNLCAVLLICLMQAGIFPEIYSCSKIMKINLSCREIRREKGGAKSSGVYNALKTEIFPQGFKMKLQN